MQVKNRSSQESDGVVSRCKKCHSGQGSAEMLVPVANSAGNGCD